MFSDFEPDYYHFRTSPRNRHPLLEQSYLYALFRSRLGSDWESPNGLLTDYIWRWNNLPADTLTRIRNFNLNSAETYRRNVDYMVDVARGHGIPIILSTFVFNGTKSNWNSYMPEELWARGIRQNNDAVRSVAAKRNVTLLNFGEHMQGRDDLFEDSIHLTPRGSLEQALYFSERIGPLITAALDRTTAAASAQ
jgi:hypothetical protein